MEETIKKLADLPPQALVEVKAEEVLALCAKAKTSPVVESLRRGSANSGGGLVFVQAGDLKQLVEATK